MIVGLKIREMSDYDEKCRVVKDLRIRLGQLNPDEKDVEEEKRLRQENEKIESEMVQEWKNTSTVH